jgi:hypothetical protein
LTRTDKKRVYVFGFPGCNLKPVDSEDQAVKRGNLLNRFRD